MNFRELTKLQEKSCNAAHMSAVMYRVETNGWSQRVHDQMDHNCKWTTADGDRGWMTGDGSHPEMVLARIWIETGYGRMTGDGSQEMDDGRRMAINPLPCYEDIEVMRSYTILEITTLISSYEVTIKHGFAGWQCPNSMDPPSMMRSITQHYLEHYSEIPNHGPTCPSSNAEYDSHSDPELQQQCRYCTSRTRLMSGGASIFKEGDDGAVFATTLPVNYRTGSAGTKHRETHWTIEKASNSEQCTQRCDGKHTYRWIKKPHAEVTIPNEIPTQSSRFQLSLWNPEEAIMD